MSDDFSLCCWVRGTTVTATFIISISPTATVGTLREELKKSQPNTFRDVDTPTVRLFKLKVPLRRPYKETLNGVTLSTDGELLDPSDEISEVFAAPPPKRHIHIIVDAPYLGIYCWVRGSTAADRFRILIHSNASIEDLKDRIQEKDPQLKNVAQYRMRLYRISESDGELRESLDTLDAGHLLDQAIPLSEYFLDVPVLQGLCVVLQVSSDFNRSANNPPWRVNHSTEGGDPIKFARDTFVADIAAYSKTAKSQSRSKRSPSPSSDSKPSSFRDRQKTEKVQIACGRPRDVEEVIPVTLLHRVFAKFIDSCQTHTITEEDNNLVSELANAMSALYENEHQRVIALNVVLAKYRLNFRIDSKVPGTAYVVDATMCVTVRDNLHPYVIAEFKNEATASNSDPYVQALAYYLELTKGYAPTLSGCALPCLLLIIFGPYIVFAGAVWTLRPAVQILSSPLAFHYHSTDTNSQIAAARHMAAFREAVRSLERYYETLPSASELANTLSHPILFPYPTSFKSLDDKSETDTNFRWTQQLDEDGGKSKRLIFFGTLTEDSTQAAICIKFVRSYSKAAHLHFASLGLAPRLRGFEELAGGWYMVIMDRLFGYELLADIDRLPESALEGIRGQLMTLHKLKLVHGDVRDTNILVKTDDRTKVMIIDFDWAGKIDEVRYPPYVNYMEIWRPEGARDGNLIKADHDEEMLNAIIARKSKQE